MNVLLIGSGGRETCDRQGPGSKSQRSRDFTSRPAIPGMRRVAERVDLGTPPITAAVAAFCTDKEIALVVVGPEQPLVGGPCR